MLLIQAPLTCGAESIQADLLIVGGTESGWAAAIQAARLGVQSITIVHDGRWLGGQYTEQGLVCVDENMGVGKVGWGPNWHPKKRSFHRFGLFKELMDEIEAVNVKKYGSPMPGKPLHGPTTFRPADAEAVFRQMLAPYITSGQVALHLNFAPYAAHTTEGGNRVAGMRFRSLRGEKQELQVHAQLTIDASDWGDVVQLAGAEYAVGPDPRSRYGEPSAQEDVSVNPPNELNPITWTMVVEEGGEGQPILAPPSYDQRRYLKGATFAAKQFRALDWDRPVRHTAIPPWPKAGQASARQATIATNRRIVDGSTSTDKRTAALLCYSNGQDYPLERLPRHVDQALDATEPGAALKNLVRMTRAQRQIIFDDAKAHALGLLHFLQTAAHDNMTDVEHSIRKFRLSPEFGTPDHLPPKPYIRESLRLQALYMMREQDSLTRGAKKDAASESFANIMYPDSVFCWQFHYDFHDTGRAYLNAEGDAGPWTTYEKPGRGVHNLSDRSVFPLRSLIPVRMEGLIGAQGNVGFSSIVSSAIRLHDQRVHIGQAAGALAASCLRHGEQPRQTVGNRQRVDELQGLLCGGTPSVPMLLWPYRDLPADHAAFVAINRLAARGLLPQAREEVDFEPDSEASLGWQNAVLERCNGYAIKPTTRAQTLSRGEFSRELWRVIEGQSPPLWPRQSSTDADADGIVDVDDPMPFDARTSYW